MTSSCKIIKARSVNLDTANKVIIEVPHVDSPDETIAVSQNTDHEQNARQKAAKIVRQAEKQAEEIIKNAKVTAEHEAAALIADATAEALQIKTSAKQSGYNEGIAAATAEGNAIKAEAQRILAEAKAEREAILASVEPEVIGLVMDITKKLLGDVYNLNPKAVLNLIKQGLLSSQISGDIVIYVSEHDFELVKSHKNDLHAITDGSVKIEITKDLSLNAMDCIIETPFGDIDCSLGQQLEHLTANLTYILDNK